MKAILYARVSTEDQDCSVQLAELAAWRVRIGWDLACEPITDTMSGSVNRRPGLDRVMKLVRERQTDAVIVWKLDRFGRSILDLLTNIEELKHYGVRLVAISQGIDTDESNPTGRFLLHILAAVAEFERTLIHERSAAGLKRYQTEYAKGTAKSRSGKDLPVGRPKRVFRRDQVALLRAQGHSWASVARRLGIPVGTARKALTGTV